jgi:hypothetical protein
MEKFRSGNVVKLPVEKTLVIIVGYRTLPSNPPYKVCDFVFVNHDNSTGAMRLETDHHDIECINEYENPCCDDTCKDCKGTGRYIETSWGMNDATLVAHNVKDWVTKTLLSGFKF